MEVKALDAWHGSLCSLRHFLRGWNIKHSGEQQKGEECAFNEGLAKSWLLTLSEWAISYELEDKLELIYQMEEISWQQKSSENWILRGIASIDFFH